MNSMFVVWLLAACLANQVTSSAVPLSSDVDDIIGIGKLVLRLVNATIDNDVTNAMELINHSLKDLDPYTTDVVRQTKNGIQREVELINQLIDTFKNQTKESGIDILDCVEDVETELNTISIHTLNLSMTCMDSALNWTTINLLKIRDDLKNITVNLTTYNEKLENCKTHECVEIISGQIGYYGLTVPAKVREEAEEARESIDEFEVALDTCGRFGIQSAQENNIIAFKDFAKCVWNKDHLTLIN